MSDDETTIDRRTMLKGAGAALAVGSVASLAGCTGMGEGKAAMDAIESVSAESPPTPSFPFSNLSPEWRYVMESMEYQNRHAAAQTAALETLLNDAGYGTAEDEK